MTVRVGLLEFSYQSGMLFIRLPSGRSLAYVKPRLGMNSFGSESVLYRGLNAAKKWDLIESYGPKFVENIVQGISRDLLCSAMMRLEERDYRIVAHVHDEVIIEARPDETVEEVCRIMGECPDWGEPPRAAGGGNTVGGEVNRSKRAPLCGVAPTEVAGQGLILRADGYTCETYRKD